MRYRDRLPENQTLWIQERIIARKEQYQDWAAFVGMSKHMFSKILHQVRPLPQKYEDKWIEMERILQGDQPCETIKQEKKWTQSGIRLNK